VQSLSEAVRNESYRKSSDQIGPRQQEVFDLLMTEPRGLTAWELAAKIGRQIYVVRPRITEFAGMGKVVPNGVRYHAPTDRNETVWCVVGAGQREFAL
jgi:hypothetical protein